MLESSNISGTSIIHSLDPRVKIMAVAVFSIVIAICSRWSALMPGLFFSLLAVVFARLSFKRVLIRLALVNGLIFFLWLFIPFSLEGNPVFKIGPFIATEEGVVYAALLTLRSNIILLGLICLVSTTSIFTLGRAMRQLRIPGKMVQLFFFTYRYLHVIHQEYLRMRNALKIRNFRPKTGMHTYRTYAYLVGMLLVRSYDRSERIQNAMLCRGFRGRFYDIREYYLRPFDYAMIFMVFLALILIALLQWTKLIY
jgi:cobalt/nickel transport system permease protein